VPHDNRTLSRIACSFGLAFGVGIAVAACAAETSKSDASDTFLVVDRGTVLLRPDGEEIEQISASASDEAALSPDGNWIAFSEFRKAGPAAIVEANSITQSSVQPQERMTFPTMWGTTGSILRPLWSFDSKRILICEQGWRDNARESACRRYDLTKKELTVLKLPATWWPSDWSADGTRLLTRLDGRVAWVNLDGTGEPEFITRELEVAYGARLSPDGRQILCLAGFRRPDERRRKLRLSVVDLKTKKRKMVDEPGETLSYCWSADGSRIAYTWLRSLERPTETPVLETFLITCDADGTNRKTITSLTCNVAGTIILFHVLAWR
jgi:Tol biopolymer transport system component